jgi:hypothetical protein
MHNTKQAAQNNQKTQESYIIDHQKFLKHAVLTQVYIFQKIIFLLNNISKFKSSITKFSIWRVLYQVTETKTS